MYEYNIYQSVLNLRILAIFHFKFGQFLRNTTTFLPLYVRVVPQSGPFPCLSHFQKFCPQFHDRCNCCPVTPGNVQSILFVIEQVVVTKFLKILERRHVWQIRHKC